MKTFISMFSGGCGLDLGVERNRFTNLARIEVDKHSCNTIKLNRPEDLLIDCDITELKCKVTRDKIKNHSGLHLRSGDLDLLVGGPPCQSFSILGNRKSVSDPRGMLIWHYLRFVRRFRPKFFIMENVKGFLSSTMSDGVHGGVLRAFVRRLLKWDLGYSVNFFVVNAVNYGCPQIRPRILAIGNRLGHQVKFPSPTHHPVVEGLFKSKRPFSTVGDAFKGLQEKHPEYRKLPSDVKEIYALIKEGGNRLSLRPELHNVFGGFYRRLHRKFPAYTLLCSPYDRHPTKNRLLSVRECARLQGFPDDWKFSGPTSAKFKQVGNAVPVVLADVASKIVLKYMNKKPKDGTPVPRASLYNLNSSVTGKRVDGVVTRLRRSGYSVEVLVR